MKNIFIIISLSIISSSFYVPKKSLGTNYKYYSSYSVQTGLPLDNSLLIYNYDGPKLSELAKFSTSKNQIWKLPDSSPLSDSILNWKLPSFGKFIATAPPNLVWVGGDLLVDETEVSNIAYQEFLFHSKLDSSEAYYSEMKPDLSTIKLSESDNQKAYFNHPHYSYFPVVGISFEQANEYCKWRSKVVTELYNNLPKVIAAKKKYSITYRLPSEQEWIKIASNGYTIDTTNRPFGYGNIYVKATLNKKWVEYSQPKLKRKHTKKVLESKIRAFNKSSDSLVNFNCIENSNELFQFTTPFLCYSFYPSAAGIYNLIGNVAEMTSTEGIAKGGSWNEPLSKCKLSSRTYYEAPTGHVGFRCICDMKEIENDM